MSLNTLLQKRGGYSLPYLVHLYNPTKSLEMYFVNNNADITYDGKLYKACALSYVSNVSTNGFDAGGTLQIDVKDNNVIDLVEGNKNIYLDVIGVINENSQITEIKTYKHKYGTVTGNRTQVTFTYDADDRPDMTFPTLIFSNQNNRGN